MRGAGSEITSAALTARPGTKGDLRGIASLRARGRHSRGGGWVPRVASAARRSRSVVSPHRVVRV
jgi:hypothetical protein